MEYLPQILTIDFGDITPTKTDWQTAVTSYLTAKFQLYYRVSWYNNDLTGLTIDETREFVGQASYGGAKQAISLVILAAETTALNTQNVLLKTLEEPPTDTLIILATTQAELLLETIRSRCQLVYWPYLPAGEAQSPAQIDILTQALNPKTTVGQLIAAASQFKERPAAVHLLKQSLAYLTKQPPTPIQGAVLKATLTCWQELIHNISTALALEHWLFKLHELALTR